LEASYRRQIARQQQRAMGLPNWLAQIAANPAGWRGEGLLPTLPPGQGFPIMSSLLGNLSLPQIPRS
jgi:hypothetical protein